MNLVWLNVFPKENMRMGCHSKRKKRCKGYYLNNTLHLKVVRWKHEGELLKF
jgi:hypothetical protein